MTAHGVAHVDRIDGLQLCRFGQATMRRLHRPDDRPHQFAAALIERHLGSDQHLLGLGSQQRNARVNFDHRQCLGNGSLVGYPFIVFTGIPIFVGALFFACIGTGRIVAGGLFIAFHGIPIFVGGLLVAWIGPDCIGPSCIASGACAKRIVHAFKQVSITPAGVGLIGIKEDRGGRNIGHRARTAPALLASFGGVLMGCFRRPLIEQFEAGFAERVAKRGGNFQPDFVRAIAADDVERGLDLVAVDRLRVVIWRGPVLRTGAIEVVTSAPDHQPGCRP